MSTVYPMTDAELEALASRDDLDETTRRLLATVTALAGERSSAYRIKSPEHRIALHDAADAAKTFMQLIKATIDAKKRRDGLLERRLWANAEAAMVSFATAADILSHYAGTR